MKDQHHTNHRKDFSGSIHSHRASQEQFYKLPSRRFIVWQIWCWNRFKDLQQRRTPQVRCWPSSNSCCVLDNINTWRKLPECAESFGKCRQKPSIRKLPSRTESLSMSFCHGCCFLSWTRNRPQNAVVRSLCVPCCYFWYWNSLHKVSYNILEGSYQQIIYPNSLNQL